MRTLKLAAAFGGLLTAAVAYGAAAAPAVNAVSPAIGPQSPAVETVQYHPHHPYYWDHHWWRHRYWRNHHWRYYN